MSEDVSGALYNEIDDYAAEWIENLVGAGHVAPGRVDRRSIVDLKPEDLEGVTQFHAFAGIGVWSHALRLAGWPDDLEVWTGSCPCQPLSQAGKQRGLDDERHLWPDWFRLIAARRPAVIFLEQVASPLGLVWLDLVQDDLERSDYAVWACDLAAASVGAPHIRQRLYVTAIRLDLLDHTSRTRGWWDTGAVPGAQGEGSRERVGVGNLADVARAAVAVDATERERESWLADDHDARLGVERAARVREDRDAPHRPDADRCGATDALADDEEFRHVEGGDLERTHRKDRPRLADSGETRGFWSAANWIFCRDGKYRPVEPGTFPLAHGSPTRVAADGTLETQPRTRTLHGYGNAIVAPLAAIFIETVMEVLSVRRSK